MKTEIFIDSATVSQFKSKLTKSYLNATGTKALLKLRLQNA